jgi:hypothetical protein
MRESSLTAVVTGIYGPFTAVFDRALAALPASASLIGTATITPSQIDATHYYYDLILNDTGTTTIGTFWFAWKPGQDYMPVQPTDILSPAN